MHYPIFTIARFSLLEAIKGRIVWVVIFLMLVSLLLAGFIGQTALTETNESQVVIMAGFLRLSAVMTIMFFVVASVSREFQDKSVELLFSVSIPRYQVFLGKYIGVLYLALLMVVIFMPALLLYADPQQVLIWSFSLLLELSVVALFSLVFILSLENIAFSLSASLGLYALTRLMPVIQAMGDSSVKTGLFDQMMNTVLDIIDLLIPRLGEFTQSAWLTNRMANTTEIISFIIETVLFIFLFSIIGILDVNRKSI